MENEREVTEVKVALVILKVLVAEIIALSKMSVIGMLKLSLDEWLSKRRLTSTTMA